MDKIVSNPLYVRGYGTFVGEGSRSLINPGNKLSPTFYYTHKIWQKSNMGSRTNTYANQGVWYITQTDVGVGFASLSPLSHPLPAGFTGPTLQEGLEAERIALAKLISYAKDAKSSDFNAAVFVAESGPSVKMIANSAARVAAALRAVRRGRLGDMYQAMGAEVSYKSKYYVPIPKGLDKKSRAAWEKAYAQPFEGEFRLKLPPRKHVADNASNYWLEAIFGWMPLLSDAHSAAEKLASVVLEEPIILRLRARHAITKTPTTYQVGTRPVVHYLTLGKVKRQYIVNYTVPAPALTMAASLGLTNPMLLAWETLPLSFVWDWFLPIGDFLESLSAFHGFVFHSGSITSMDEQESRAFSEGFYHVNSYDWLPDGKWGPKDFTTQSTSSGRVKTLRFTRLVLTEFPVPKFHLQLKDNKGVQSALHHLVTLSALLRQRNPIAR